MPNTIQALLRLVLIAALAAASLAHAEDVQDDEAVLRRIKTEEWPRLYRQQDVAGLDRLLHPSFESIDAKGERSTKAQEMAYVKANRPTYESFRYDIGRLDIYPQGVAIVDGTGRVQEDACKGFSYRSSNVFVKEDGRWRPIASHISGVSPWRGTAPACAEQDK